MILKIKSRLIKILVSPILFFVLVGLYPTVFLVSKNWFVYEFKQLIFLIVIPCISGLIGLLLIISFYLVNKIFLLIKRIVGNKFKKIKVIQNKRKKTVSKFNNTKIRTLYIKLRPQITREFVTNIFYFSFGFFILYFLLQSSIPITKITASILLLIFTISCYLIKKFNFNYINLVLLLITIFASFELVYSLSTNSIKDDGLVPTLNKDTDSQIKFKTTPNIYLVHLEAYQSPVAMQKIYDLDNKDFVDKLNKMGFFVSQNNFSNYHATLFSTGTMFLQQHHYYKVANGLEDAVGVRDMIGGRLYNPTLTIFKNNGYYISYIHTNNYIFMGSEKINYFFPQNSIHDSLLIFQNSYIDKLKTKIFKLRTTSIKDNNAVDLKTYNEILYENLNKNILSPKFYYLRGAGVHHSPSGEGRYSWKDSDGDWKSRYINYVNNANPKIITMLEKIIEKDPNGIIILYGDHGAWRYRNIWKGNNSIEINQLIYERKQLTAEDLAYDLFGVFSAVRNSNGNSQFLENETHVNLFRKLFSELSQNDLLLKDKPENESYLQAQGKLYVLTRDGKALDKMELKEDL